MSPYYIPPDIPQVIPGGVPGGPIFYSPIPDPNPTPINPTPIAPGLIFNRSFSLRGGPYERNWIFASFLKYFNVGEIYDIEEKD